MGTKLRKTSSCLAASVWALMSFTIVMLLLCLAGATEYKAKADFLLHNGYLLLIGVALCMGLAVLYLRFREKVDIIAGQWTKGTIVILSAVLLAVQAYVFYQTYFLTGWDSEAVITTVMELRAGRMAGEWYFSVYPNNLLLVYLYNKLFAINMRLGDVSLCAYFAVLFQCVLSVITGGLLFSVVKKMSKITYAFLVWFVYVAHVALSPWISILYSDPIALMFPLTMVWLYQKSQEAKYSWLYWAGIGVMAYIGYKFKPQVIIVLIAIVLVQGVRWFDRAYKKEWLRRVKNIMAFLTAMGLSLVLVVMVCIPSLGIPVDSRWELSWPHFMMMGLNRDTDGAYNGDDVSFSLSFDTTQVRNENNLRVVRERIQEYGIGGLCDHLTKKILVIYGDGTYAWQKEGNFFSQMHDPPNQWLAPILRDIYYGKYTDIFSTFEHVIWLSLMFGSGGVAFWMFSEKKPNATLCVMVLSLIGLTLFQLIFEARARYLFLYAPYYIVVALFGWIGWKRAVCALIQKKRRKQS